MASSEGNDGFGSARQHSSNNNRADPPIPAPSLQEIESYIRCRYYLSVREAAQQYHNSMAAVSSPPSSRADDNLFSATSQNNNSQNHTFLSRTDMENTRKWPDLPPFEKTNPDLARGKFAVDHTWVDGDVQFEIPKEQISSDGKTPYFGWAFCHTSDSKNFTTNMLRQYHYCLGVLKCPHCDFLARPLYPKKKSMGEQPRAPKNKHCPLHSDDLIWVPCTGGPLSSKKGEQGKLQPCKLILNRDLDGSTTEIIASHVGNHSSHPRPPITKPAPTAMKKFIEIVKTNPAAGPAKLRMGSSTLDSVGNLDEAFTNQDRLGYYRRKTLAQGLRPQGIRGSIGALLSFNKDLNEPFIIHMDLMSQHNNIITMQTPYMKSVLNQGASGLQSDTVEGVIHDFEYTSGTVDIHFTSALDPIQQRWVPVLVSIIFGRAAPVFYSHWKSLFNSYDNVSTWEEFSNIFTGITVDWSTAMEQSFLDSLLDHATTTLGGKDIQRSDLQSYLRKCEVHFKRILTRIKKNAKLVPPEKTNDFKMWISILTAGDTTFDEFEQACKGFTHDFPNLKPWLLWYLHEDRAPSFFSACQNFTKEERQRFSKLEKTTNAQENVGRQFQYQFITPMTINSAVLNLYKFVSQFSGDQAAELKGLPKKYGQRPRKLDPQAKKKRHSKNDGRPPDTTRKLIKTKKKKVQPRFPIFEGIRWGMPQAWNTCPLDSWLDLIYIPHRAKLNLNPYPELQDNTSILSRTFEFMLHNDHDAARMLWLHELYQFSDEDLLVRKNLFGSTDRFFEKIKVKNQADRPNPLDETLRLRFRRSIRCVREGGCKMLDSTLVCSHLDDPDEEVVDLGANYREVRRSQCRVTCANGLNKDEIGKRPEDQLKSLLEEHLLGAFCSAVWFNAAEGKQEPCTGPSMFHDAIVEKWPHTLAFDMTNTSGGTVNDVPLTFEYKKKRFVLRGFLLGDGGHFTAVVRCPNAWMHYDGDVPVGRRFEFFPLEQGRQVMKGRRINMVTYEVLDITETRNWADETFDLFSNFECKETKKQPIDLDSDWSDEDEDDESKKQKSEPKKDESKKLESETEPKKDESKKFESEPKSDDDSEGTSASVLAERIRKGREELGKMNPKKVVTDGLKKLRSDVKQTGARKDDKVPTGFSVSKSIQSRGPKAKCHGCKREIGYADKHIRYSYKRSKRYKKNDVLKFHMNVKCLNKMRKDHMMEFMQKRWPDKDVNELKQQMKKK